MKYLPLFFFFLTVSITTSGSSITVTGKTGGTWNVDTVHVAGDLLLPPDTFLLVQPGTRVIFQGPFEFRVRGVIRAEGTLSAPVVFTIADTSGFADTLSTAGGWHGFVFDQVDPANDSSLFSWCRFEFGKAVSADTAGKYGGAIRIFNWNKLRISDCDFFCNMAHKWGGAVYAKYSGIRILRTLFRLNRCGTVNPPYGYGGALCVVHSSPDVRYCLFEDNSTTGVGGGASFEYADPILRDNVFHRNLAGLGGGFGFLRSIPIQAVSNNLVYGNTAVFFGGGISCNRSNPVLVNNTITGNFASYGGGFYANDSAFPSNYNSIFYGNAAGVGQEVYIWDIFSAPGFIYCNVAGGKEDFQGSGGQQGYHGRFENNLDTIPGFSGSGEFPFAPVTVSPMVDAGTPDTSGLQVPTHDLAGLLRIWNGRIDIGAYEWNPPAGLTENWKARQRLLIMPNPVRDNMRVPFILEQTETLTATVCDIHGRERWRMAPQTFPAGKNQLDLTEFLLQCRDIREGIFFLTLSGRKTAMEGTFMVSR